LAVGEKCIMGKFIFAKYNYNGMGRARSRHGGEETCMYNIGGKPQNEGHKESLEVGMRLLKFLER
jgi:hypothetical protein